MRNLLPGLFFYMVYTRQSLTHTFIPLSIERDGS